MAGQGVVLEMILNHVKILHKQSQQVLFIRYFFTVYFVPHESTISIYYIQLKNGIMMRLGRKLAIFIWIISKSMPKFDLRTFNFNIVMQLLS